MQDVGLVNTALVLLGLLFAFLAGGFWIGLSLVAVGFAAMLIATDVPVGPVLATSVWASSASWTLTAAATRQLIASHDASVATTSEMRSVVVIDVFSLSENEITT